MAIVLRALQPQYGRIPCPVDRNLEMFLTSHVEFFSFLDNVEIVVNKICFEKKCGGHRTSKIVKSKQSIAVAIYPIIVHLST